MFLVSVITVFFFEKKRIYLNIFENTDGFDGGRFVVGVDVVVVVVVDVLFVLVVDGVVVAVVATVGEPALDDDGINGFAVIVVNDDVECIDV